MQQMLTIVDVAKLYCTSEGAIRTAIWRHREYGIDPGFPAPLLIRGRYRWMAEDIERHLQSLVGSDLKVGEGARVGRPRRAHSAHPPKPALTAAHKGDAGNEP